MHALETSKLASLFSQSQLTLAPEEILAQTLTHKYWTLSKCRGQRWLSTLTQLKNEIQAEQRSSAYSRTLPYRWTQFQTVAEEILISDLLMRVFGAMVSAKHGNNQDIAAVLKSVSMEHARFRTHLESFFELIPDRVGAEFKNNLTLMIQNIESSTDFLLGHLSDTSTVVEYAFDKKLVFETMASAVTCSDKVLDKIRLHIGKEMLAAVTDRSNGIAFSPDLNQQLAGCLTSCFLKKASPTRVNALSRAT